MRMVMAFGLILGFSAAVAAGEKAAAPEKAASKPISAGFEKIKGLVGDWTGAGVGEGHNEKVTISYAITSGGSAVMETLQMDDHTMVTVYHPDGESVMMTHYCAAGNQPRMRAKGGDKDLAFTFVDVTNLASPDALHMHDLKLTFDDADHITQEWTTRTGDKKTPVMFKLARKK
jgi:hypothetical protein